jgi:hypothetical protein
LHPKIFNPKSREAPPFAKQRAICTEWTSTILRERMEISGGGSTNSKEAHPQVEKKEDTVGSVTMINGAISSTLMG